MSAAKELREYAARSNALHQEYLGDPELLERYERFVAWQLDYMLPFYEDLRASEDYAAAVDFVVSDLTGMGINQRDHDLARVVPLMCKMLPDKASRTVATAVQLNARVLSINRALCRHFCDDQPDDAEVPDAEHGAPRRTATRL